MSERRLEIELIPSGRINVKTRGGKRQDATLSVSFQVSPSSSKCMFIS